MRFSGARPMYHPSNVVLIELVASSRIGRRERGHPSQPGACVGLPRDLRLFRVLRDVAVSSSFRLGQPVRLCL